MIFLREEWYEYKDSRSNTGKNRIRIYIYKCSDCDNELRIRKQYLKNHRGKCKICSKKVLRSKPYESLFNDIKRNAKRRNIDFSLTYEKFLELVKQNCYYCDARLKFSEFNIKQTGYASNLDRKINSLGYTTENSVSCCWRCNKMKGDLDFDEFIAIIRRILNNLEEK